MKWAPLGLPERLEDCTRRAALAQTLQRRVRSPTLTYMLTFTWTVPALSLARTAHLIIQFNSILAKLERIPNF